MNAMTASLLTSHHSLQAAND